MRRTMLTLVATLAIIFAGPKSFSQDGDGNTYHLDILNNYYSDDSYSSAVGWDERDCSGSLNSNGSDSSWRYHEVYSCDGFQISGSCQYQSGSGWVSVQCPDTNVTAQGRLHIPVG